MRSGFRSLWPPIVLAVILIAAWQFAAGWQDIPDWILPKPTQIVQAGAADLARVWMHTIATTEVAMAGFVLGVLCGIALAVLLHALPMFRSSLYPLIILSQNIPIIALAPLLIIWFGFGVLPKILIVILVCFFPVVVATMDGFAQTDREMLNYMLMIGAGRMQIFRKLEFPHALPSIFSGLKISATYSITGAVVAEWLGSNKGLGEFMQLSAANFRTDRVFVAIVVIVILSLLLFGLILLMERMLIRWKPDERKGGKIE